MSSIRKWIAPIVSAASILVSSQSAHGLQQIEQAPCPSLSLAANVDTLVLRCAKVTVTQRRRGGTEERLVPVELPVVIFARRTTPMLATPVVYLSGGPGESAIDDVALGFLGTPAGQRIIEQHPIIAFDQRGFSGRGREAKPWIGGLRRPDSDTMPLTRSQLNSVLQAVSASLKAEGIDIRNFNTIEAATDVVDVLRSLGYRRAILFGSSYGTRVAMQVMAQAEDMIEAAILDAAVPPSASAAFDLDSANATRRRALKRLVDDCRDDVRCSELYPHIEDDWSRLARRGSFVEVAGNVAGVAGRSLVLGPDLLAVLGAALVFEEYREVAPALLAELAREGGVSLGSAGGSIVPAAIHLGSGVTTVPKYGLGYLSVVCAESPLGIPQYGGEDVCRALGVPFGGPPFVRVVSSRVPALLFAARYDGQSRPEWADHAAKTLAVATVVHLPGIGHIAHTQPATQDCAAEIVLSFLSSPVDAPDVRCVDTLRAPFFLDPIVARARITGSGAAQTTRR